MRKIIAYPFSVVYYLGFGILLLCTHVVQWVALNFFGYRMLKANADFVALMSLRLLNFLGTRTRFTFSTPLPTGIPLIFVANHQSTYDVSILMRYLKKHHPKFISKKELGKGIPFVSAYLRNSGCVLIDRKDREKSIADIEKFAQNLERKNWSAFIFPEGTRSRDGKIKEFRTGGLATLIENMPSAYVVPISINNSWKLARYRYFPMELGVFMKCFVHEPISTKNTPPYKIIEKTEALIRSGVS